MTDQTKIQLQSKHIRIKNILKKKGNNELRNEILAGLLTEKKYIPSKFFYDGHGSALFREITNLPEYYPARTEKLILNNVNLSFLNNYNNLNIIELGSGDHSKISILLKKVPPEFRKRLTYMPVDISASAVKQAGRDLHTLYPDIKIEAYIADFFNPLIFIPERRNRLFCFFGSTIGNLTREKTNRFMTSIAGILKLGEFFLVGFDTVKEISILEKAYNDSQSITKAFNLNILNVVNTIAETDFNNSDFNHIAFFNVEQSRIEMHLEAKRNTEIYSRHLKQPIKIKKGERIYTENSYKFSSEYIKDIADAANFKINTSFTDEKNWFSLVLFEKY